HMTHASQDEGAALADVIFGAYNPGGHTVATWPASIDQLPPMMDYDIRHGRTYMYMKSKPLYPFGYGLSYTSFRYANLRTDRPVLAKNGVATVSVDVTNSGGRAGDAVPQLYVHHLGSKVGRPIQQLAGFEDPTQGSRTRLLGWHGAYGGGRAGRAWGRRQFGRYRAAAEARHKVNS
ncbi:MAG: glycoside hydrolase family 3 C-terminal domain-containing protein, partial [Xanthomonadales bacterium]|nr:glycoside hydrolase family 3 C-terminal domain-containing protein [Xanthomonadales bacterium]